MTKSPWSIGVLFGVAGFIVIRYGLGWGLSLSANPYLVSVATPLRQGALAPFAWLVLALGLTASLLSALRNARSASQARLAKPPRRTPTLAPEPGETTQVPDGAHNADSLPDRASYAQQQSHRPYASAPAPVTQANIAKLSWFQFEQLVAASFRRKGFAAELMPEGADEGIDIILRERGNMLVVQCKHWRASHVGVNVVRELYGVMHAKHARKAILATSGYLTPDAQAFCRANAMYYLDADSLLSFIDPEAMPPQHQIADDRTQRCPLCGSSMRLRSARDTGRRFWGCTRFPGCRGKRFSGLPTK